MTLTNPEVEQVTGILLAGGKGTRLFPSTISVSKHLLPVFDKPMIYYSMSLLMLAGVRVVTIVCNLEDLPHYVNLLSDGSNLGMEIRYSVQMSPGGIPDALLSAE